MRLETERLKPKHSFSGLPLNPNPVTTYERKTNVLSSRDAVALLAHRIWKDVDGGFTPLNRAGNKVVPDQVHGEGGNTRVMLRCSEKHYAMLSEREKAAVVDVSKLPLNIREALDRLELECMAATGNLARPPEFELLMTPDGYIGQVWHMDSSAKRGRVFTACVAPLMAYNNTISRQGTGTRFLQYDPPVSLSKADLMAALPPMASWEGMAAAELPVAGPNDLTIFCTCHIHAGPANNSGVNRYATFMAWPANATTIGRTKDEEVVFAQ